VSEIEVIHTPPARGDVEEFAAEITSLAVRTGGKRVLIESAPKRCDREACVFSGFERSENDELAEAFGSLAGGRLG